ncbi:Ig-like domain-containing protein [Phytoactinopolyspora limicola]|uniref:Ig-like domain-containing protein n=1 Tax=Phytoactinopolyspora limicola TaxID=2715536 RepID=UPI00140E812A|nr:Ig-like domain-containing protein [Phytoactinopolyspora limicola]
MHVRTATQPPRSARPGGFVAVAAAICLGLPLTGGPAAAADEGDPAGGVADAQEPALDVTDSPEEVDDAEPDMPDPTEDPVVDPLEVAGSPEIAVTTEPSSFHFYGTVGDGRTYIHSSYEGGEHVTIHNLGGSTLEWSILASSTGCAGPTAVAWLGTSPSSGEVGAGQTSGEIFLDWHGTADVELELGTHEVSLCVSSNDAATPMVVVPLTVVVVDTHELPVDEVEIETPEPKPEPYPVPVGETVALRATAILINGAEINVTDQAQWSSDDNTVATVTAGDVAGVAAGVSTITAEYGGREGRISVQVDAGNGGTDGGTDDGGTDDGTDDGGTDDGGTDAGGTDDGGTDDGGTDDGGTDDGGTDDGGTDDGGAGGGKLPDTGAAAATLALMGAVAVGVGGLVTALRVRRSAAATRPY